MDILILKDIVEHLKNDGFNTKLSVDEWMSIVNFIKKRDQALHIPAVVGQSEQFYCDGQENNKVRCETQCLGCAGMQEIYGQ